MRNVHGTAQVCHSISDEELKPWCANSLQRKNPGLKRVLTAVQRVNKPCDKLIGLECIFLGFGRSASYKWLVFCLKKREDLGVCNP